MSGRNVEIPIKVTLKVSSWFVWSQWSCCCNGLQWETNWKMNFFLPRNLQGVYFINLSWSYFTSLKSSLNQVFTKLSPNDLKDDARHPYDYERPLTEANHFC